MTDYIKETHLVAARRTMDAKDMLVCIVSSGVDALHAAVNARVLDLEAAAVIATLPPAQQEQLLDMAADPLFGPLFTERFSAATGTPTGAPSTVGRVFDPILLPQRPETAVSRHNYIFKYVSRQVVEEILDAHATHRFDYDDGCDFYIDLSPWMANAMLETRHPKLRELDARYGLALSRAMTAGEFSRRVGSIAFDRQGNLVDGQHRLMAIADSDLTIPNYRVQVHFNPKAPGLIDMNKPRRRRRGGYARSASGACS